MEDFHDLLVPEALEYYLGLNEDFDMLANDGEGDGESGSEHSSDDEGDKKVKPAKKDAPAKEGEEKQECKQ